MKIVIVGAVAGGASAAARARRLDEDAEIILFERGPAPSFANCGLPYYVGGVIEERDKLLVAPTERLVQRYRLDVRTLQSVQSIDRAAKTVTVRRLADGTEYQESYDKLILSPGAEPARLSVPGADLPGIHTLRNLEDGDRLLQAVTDGAQRAVVVGAGFIGLEIAENLVHRGIETTVVELAGQVLPPWDREMTAPVFEQLEKNGICLCLSDSVQTFRTTDNGLQVVLESGDEFHADFVVLSIGVRPDNELAVDAGLEVGERGGIQVNRHMQTNDPDIYAVGDAIEVLDFVSGTPAQVPLAGPANRQGRIAADHIFGREAAYRGTQGTAIIGVFDVSAAATGVSEKVLRRSGTPYQKVYVHAGHHAGYYPDAQRVTLKLLFAPDTGRLLGAQAVGGPGVDKRIDVLAVAIQAGMTVFDLEEMELAYAPQFGSAKDPVNMLGFVAANVLRGDHPVIHVDELAAAQERNAVLIDVRTERESKQGHIPGSVNLPLDELRSRMDEVPRDRPLVVYCQVGMRGYLAARILQQKGYDVLNIPGGYTTYLQFQRTNPEAI